MQGSGPAGEGGAWGVVLAPPGPFPGGTVSLFRVVLLQGLQQHTGSSSLTAGGPWAACGPHFLQPSRSSPSLAQTGMTLRLLGREPERLQLQRKTGMDGAEAGGPAGEAQRLGGAPSGRKGKQQSQGRSLVLQHQHLSPTSQKPAEGVSYKCAKKRKGSNTPVPASVSPLCTPSACFNLSVLQFPLYHFSAQLFGFSPGKPRKPPKGCSQKKNRNWGK